MALHTEVIQIERPITCKYCGNPDLYTNGKHKGIQYYLCKKCHHRANGKDTFPHRKHDRETIIRAMTYYYNGISFTGVQNVFDDLMQINMSSGSIWEWIVKYTELVIPFVRDVKPPKIGNTWIADETQVRLRTNKIDKETGKHIHAERWLWSVIDEKTRYILALKFSASRDTETAEALFRDALLHAGKRPKDIITDKLQGYQGAFRKVFYSRYKEHKIFHWKSEGFTSWINTNLIERWHEYVKQRYKIMRHFKNKKAAELILNGIVINYNWLWEHGSLGMAPIQKAGINVEKLNIKNWGDLIDLATQFRNEKQKNPSDFTFWLTEQERMEKENDIELYLEKVERWRKNAEYDVEVVLT